MGSLGKTVGASQGFFLIWILMSFRPKEEEHIAIKEICLYNISKLYKNIPLKYEILYVSRRSLVSHLNLEEKGILIIHSNDYKNSLLYIQHKSDYHKYHVLRLLGTRHCASPSHRQLCKLGITYSLTLQKKWYSERFCWLLGFIDQTN